MGESIVWSISTWIWETRREWGLVFFSADSPRSLSTSPFPSYSGLLLFIIIGVSCLSLSHVSTFFIPVVFTILFCIPSSFVSSLFIFFYPHRSSFCFLDGVSSSVHLYVGWVTRLTRLSDIWHCTLRGLVLSFGYLGLVSHRFIHLLTLAFITVWVVRLPWGHKFSCSLQHISFGQLRPLVEVWDVSRPSFLEDIEESHNAFSIQSPRLWSTIRGRWCKELGLSRTPLFAALTWSYWGIPYILAWWHRFLHVHMQSISLGDVWHRCLDILHIQPRFFI